MYACKSCFSQRFVYTCSIDAYYYTAYMVLNSKYKLLKRSLICAALWLMKENLFYFSKILL